MMISAGGEAVGRRPSIFPLLHQAAKAQRLAAWRSLEKPPGGDAGAWAEARKAPEGGTPEGLRKRNSDEPGRGSRAGGRNSHEFSCAQANFSVR